MKISNSVEVCNLALLRINQSPISSLTDDSLQANRCNMTYEQAKTRLLEEYNWTFAIRRAELVKAVDNSRLPNETDAQYNLRRDPLLFEYTRKFVLPDKFLRIVAVYDGSNRIIHANMGTRPAYVREGMFLLTDLSACKMSYIADVDVVSTFSMKFIDCLVLDLAIRLTKFFNDSSAYLQQLQAEFEAQIASAKISDCQQTMMYSLRSNPLLMDSWSF